MDSHMTMGPESAQHNLHQQPIDCFAEMAQEACNWGEHNNMSMDTGASAQGVPPDMTRAFVEEGQQDYSGNTLTSFTGPVVAMAEASFGAFSMQQPLGEMAMEAQIQARNHARTQSDPAAYSAALNNQFVFTGCAANGFPVQGQQQQMAFRSASDGQIFNHSYLQQQQPQQQHVQSFRTFDAADPSLTAKRVNGHFAGSDVPAAKVAIPKNGSFSLKREGSLSAQSPGGESSEMTAKRSGPMSANITVPPRPRPGRKPIAQEDAQDRRRYQNRLAQRQFRDKRARKNVELEDTLKEKTAEFHRTEGELRNQVEVLRARDQEREAHEREMQQLLQELKSEVEELRAALRQVTAERDQARRSNPGQFRDAAGQPPSQSSYGPGAGTPNSSEYNHDEIDFTNFGRSNSSYALQNSTSNEGDQMDYGLDNDEHCGFCTDKQNCACEQERKRQKTKPTPVEPRVSLTMPGNCDMCRSDPERARACREMAAATQPADKDATRTPSKFSSGRSSIDSTTMPPPPRVSCSAMVDHFNRFGERTSTISGLFGGRPLPAYPVTKGGYEFDEATAAEVLTTLAGHGTDNESTNESSQ